MARSRRTWSSIRSEVRRKINDTGTTQHWSDTDLLDYFNAAKDEREMQLFGVHQGWGVSVANANVVAGQRSYVLPEQTGRIKTIYYVSSDGNNKRILNQDRQYIGSYQGDDTQYGPPVSFNIKDNHIYLYPTPSESITNGLQIEIEALSDRIENDNDKLPDSWPGFVEVLLVYDTAILALDAQATAAGDLGESQIAYISRARDRFEKNWEDYIFQRTQGVIASKGFNLGA